MSSPAIPVSEKTEHDHKQNDGRAGKVGATAETDQGAQAGQAMSNDEDAEWKRRVTFLNEVLAESEQLQEEKKQWETERQRLYDQYRQAIAIAHDQESQNIDRDYRIRGLEEERDSQDERFNRLETEVAYWKESSDFWKKEAKDDEVTAERWKEIARKQKEKLVSLSGDINVKDEEVKTLKEEIEIVKKEKERPAYVDATTSTTDLQPVPAPPPELAKRKADTMDEDEKSGPESAVKRVKTAQPLADKAWCAIM